jgi:hypothetical protein
MWRVVVAVAKATPVFMPASTVATPTGAAPLLGGVISAFTIPSSIQVKTLFRDSGQAAAACHVPSPFSMDHGGVDLVALFA